MWGSCGNVSSPLCFLPMQSVWSMSGIHPRLIRDPAQYASTRTTFHLQVKDLRILVSNDDGIDSPGIYALVQAMRSIGHVDVVAPDTQQSAVGHALTVADPLRVEKHERMGEFFGWAVN